MDAHVVEGRAPAETCVAITTDTRTVLAASQRPSGASRDSRMSLQQPTEVLLPRLAALHLPARSLGQTAQRYAHDLVRRQPERLADPGGHAGTHGPLVARAALHHEDQLLVPIQLCTERHDVATAHTFEFRYGPLEVLRMEVRPANDDEILAAPAHEQLAVGDVAEVAGAQEAFTREALGVGF